jgi:DNA-binding MarR family transcriptional regulator
MEEVMEKLDERLLSAWLQLSVNICNDRVVRDMPYNEALICNILKHAGESMTATQLCEQTKMLKSQMNRTLNSMEEKGLIQRERSLTDKRQVYISLNLENGNCYQEAHSRSLQLVNEIISRLGEKRTEEFMEALTDISNIAKEIL